MSTATNPNLHPALTGWTGQPYARRFVLRDQFTAPLTDADATTLHLWLKAWQGAVAVVDATGMTPLPDGWLWQVAHGIPYSHVKWLGLTAPDRVALARVAFLGPRATSS